MNSINKFALDLRGLTVFTESATGNYLYTPIIVALAGAEKVYAITKDSKYGSKEVVKERTLDAAKLFGVANIINVIYDKKPEYIKECDIITNSGFARPIDKKMIDSMKSTAVIPLMFETWEYRDEDLDLEYCRKKKVLVLGTNEDHDKLKLFYSAGFLITKLLFECGMEVYKNKYIVICSGKIGQSIQDFFDNNMIEHIRITCSPDEHAPQSKVYFYKYFDFNTMRDIDAVILYELLHDIAILSSEGVINRNNIDDFRDKLFIHVCGRVDLDFIKNNSINLYPPDFADFGYMTRSGDYLGPVITIDLITGGLKVGEIMSRLRKSGKSYQDSIDIATKNPLVMDFSGAYIYERK